MGGLCASMANLVAGEAGSEERPGREGEEKEEESWEKEVNMGVFYTDAVKYWEVKHCTRLATFIFLIRLHHYSACYQCVCVRAVCRGYRLQWRACWEGLDDTPLWTSTTQRNSYYLS